VVVSIVTLPGGSSASVGGLSGFRGLGGIASFVGGRDGFWRALGEVAAIRQEPPDDACQATGDDHYVRKRDKCSSNDPIEITLESTPD
jgi:hypothetical protein